MSNLIFLSVEVVSHVDFHGGDNDPIDRLNGLKSMLILSKCILHKVLLYENLPNDVVVSFFVSLPVISESDSRFVDGIPYELPIASFP